MRMTRKEKLKQLCLQKQKGLKKFKISFKWLRFGSTPTKTFTGYHSYLCGLLAVNDIKINRISMKEIMEKLKKEK